MSHELGLLNLLGPAALATLLFASDAAFAQPPTTRATTPWDAAFFDYKKTPLVVEETTPTAAQVDWRGRPPRMPANLAAPEPSNVPAKPWSNGSLNIVRLRFRDLEGADVPVLLVTPANQK